MNQREAWRAAWRRARRGRRDGDTLRGRDAIPWRMRSAALLVLLALATPDPLDVAAEGRRLRSWR